MHRRVFLSMTGALALAGCGGFRDSRINPRNWFGRSTSRARDTAAASTGGNPLIPEDDESIFRRRNREEVYPGTPVDQITALAVERTSDGAIIRATGQTARQGALGSSFKCNTQSPLGIGCCDGHTKQAPQQRGTWRDISRA